LYIKNLLQQYMCTVALHTHVLKCTDISTYLISAVCGALLFTVGSNARPKGLKHRCPCAAYIMSKNVVIAFNHGISISKEDHAFLLSLLVALPPPLYLQFNLVGASIYLPYLQYSLKLDSERGELAIMACQLTGDRDVESIPTQGRIYSSAIEII
jgi:hypothetical protein